MGTTVAGNGHAGAGLEEFNLPYKVVLDSRKTIFVADLQNQRITR